uniref:tRNA threonylcarbamoyl adenosine modification protein, Sua5/YciO/YrdC/YwlC family n=1 Tax=Candidatus Kentrum sp. TUN TaxID=2126343 RepID=A0A450ZTK3_9GAMM|nr:MAG: tRNA threonylcarbamoyl adenosine modification protein, Sua5/YciO/YrdC/YwlC family [Candidatus Kentron sp. TUN]VFK55352.1 MAG: tRNA threonylcarbamoyl adenosine modification protein, Sua5/YciO/YrdC/YwlC family [Candidatus Kentron sp. TUN]VFK57102.1 MAG: tRNA threonylcarbamoyl adenosine modification protein, Sua5/YciO/YrdC/YwlC family [Candidatus Kentron sp. TUN]
MTQYFQIHPDNPQPRLINQAVAILRRGGVIAYPTDSCYALGCHIGNKAAIERIRRIRKLDNRHNFTLVCRDLSEISLYGRIDNIAFRLIKSHTPGPYTFILKATTEVPRRLLTRRKTIGLRIPDSLIIRSLSASLDDPVMSVTLIPPEEDLPITDPNEIATRFGNNVDLIIDGGSCGVEPTTVVDLTDELPRLLRRGLGSTRAFER